MKRSNGFTLIELIAVILIVGVLSVTAAPKFLNLKSNANTSVITNIGGTWATVTDQVYAKAAIEGKESLQSSTVTMFNQPIAIQYGYPSTNWNSSIQHLISGTIHYLGHYATRDSTGKDELRTQQCPQELCVIDGFDLGRADSSLVNTWGVGIIPKGYTFESGCIAYYVRTATGRSVGSVTTGC
ncbi:type II secretion system protein [Vibrio sp. T187]|uniref:type II secretion system protein n=1 Tax=Vibrio TaxID=662 RepID=UPI0010C9D27A|nr:MULTISPECIES: prepilin-type N-terminal cleavage/methylation domain-containing protein [Vibrio]MBW3697729.1 type II secretion system protein [Vibrio sp. T187]